MKISRLLIIFIIIGCILAFGYVSRSTSNPVVKSLNATPGNNITITNSSNFTTSIGNPDSPNSKSGQIRISIGQYNALLPVSIDNIKYGNVSGGYPLTLNLAEGNHRVTVCTDTLCEKADVEIKSGIKTTLDFEQRLITDVPQGSLSISIGSYPATLPVFIDNDNAGDISPGNPLNQTISAGNHTVKICIGTTCFNKSVVVPQSTMTILDFEDQLENDLDQGSLFISIGGFNAELPVSVDNTSVGTVSMEKPLDLKVTQGNHSVQVCAGKVCEFETVQVRFAKQSVVDFGERLKNDVEFPSPTIRIARYSLSGTTMTVDVEFINPDDRDHSMSATIVCTYTSVNSEDLRTGDSTRTGTSRLVKAGERVTQQATLRLTGGSDLIANVPAISDIMIV